jgi:predicted N-acetyltransferase YhbS
MELPYTTVPAVKVARLAVSVGCQGKGIGKEALYTTSIHAKTNVES